MEENTEVIHTINDFKVVISFELLNFIESMPLKHFFKYG